MTIERFHSTNNQMASSKNHGQFWLAQANKVRRKHNLAWWLQYFLPSFAALSLIFACASLLHRSRGELGLWYWLILLASTMFLVLLCYLISQRKFIDNQTALSLIDASANLNNRLGCAGQNIGSWPSPAEGGDSWRWNLPLITAPLLTGCFLIFSSALIPIQISQRGQSISVQQPLAWPRTESLLEKLREQAILSPETLERLEHQLGALRKQPQQEWYNQGNLEAGDALLRQLKSDMQRLKKQLEEASKAMPRSAQRGAEDNQQSDLAKQKAQALANSLQGLKDSPLALNSEMLRQLQKSGEPGAGNLSSSEIYALQKQLKQEADNLERFLENESGTSAQKSGKGNEQFGSGFNSSRDSSSGGKQGQNGMPGQDGSAGISRGPGTAPIEKVDRPPPAAQFKPEQISGENQNAKDPSGIKLITRSNPPAPSAKFEASAGEKAAHDEENGKAVWLGDYTPEERQLLQQVFK